MRDGSLGGLPGESPALSEQRLRHRAIPIVHAARLSALHEEFAGLVWEFSCQVVFWFVAGSLLGAEKAVLRRVAFDQVRGARGRCRGTEMLAQLSGLPLSAACVSQPLTPEHAEG